MAVPTASSEHDLGDRGADDAPGPTFEDVLAACAPAILGALGDTHREVRGAISLAQTGVLGRAPDAIATLHEHWRSLVRPPHSAQFVTDEMDLQQLQQAAMEAGVEEDDTKEALLRWLPRNCPPSLFKQVHHSAHVDHALAQGAAANPARAANPAWASHTHIDADSCRAPPYRLPDDILDRLPWTTRPKHNKRWYPLAAVIAVTLAFHSPRVVSDGERQRLKRMQQQLRHTAAKQAQAEEAERAKKEREAAQAPARAQRLEDVAAAFAAAGLPCPPSDHTAIGRRQMSVTANHILAEHRAAAPSLADAVAAAKEAAWYSQHIPEAVPGVYKAVGREFSAGHAQRRTHAVVAALVLGPAVCVAEIEGCPPEVVRASGRIQALESALAALGVECRPPWMALTDHNPLNAAPLEVSPISWAYACEISPVPVLDTASAAAAVEQAAWFMAHGMESYVEAQSVSAPPEEMKRTAGDLVQRLGPEAAAAMPKAPGLVKKVATDAAIPAFLAEHGPVEARRLALLGPQENGPLALRTQTSCHELMHLAKAAIHRASVQAGAAFESAAARPEVASLLSNDSRLGLAPAVIAAALGGLSPLEISLLVSAASYQVHKLRYPDNVKKVRCPFPGCKAGPRLFSEDGFKSHWRYAHRDTPLLVLRSVEKSATAALTQRLPKELGDFAVALAARLPKPELSAACAEWAALASGPAPAPAGAPAAAPAPA